MSIDSALSEHLIRVFNEGIPFNKFVGFSVSHIERGQASISMGFRDELVGDTDKQILHGGVLSSLIDTAGGLTAFSVLDFSRELTVNTVDMRIDFLRPARGERFVASGKVIRKGTRICVTVVEVTNENDVLVAHGTASYSILSADSSGAAGAGELSRGLLGRSD